GTGPGAEGADVAGPAQQWAGPEPAAVGPSAPAAGEAEGDKAQGSAAAGAAGEIVDRSQASERLTKSRRGALVSQSSIHCDSTRGSHAAIHRASACWSGAAGPVGGRRRQQGQEEEKGAGSRGGVPED